VWDVRPTVDIPTPAVADFGGDVGFPACKPIGPGIAD
jgi:hypothetical protein